MDHQRIRASLARGIADGRQRIMEAIGRALSRNYDQAEITVLLPGDELYHVAVLPMGVQLLFRGDQSVTVGLWISTRELFYPFSHHRC